METRTTRNARPGRPSSGGPGSQGGMTRQKAVRLPDEVCRQLEERAAAEGVTVSDVMWQAIKQYLTP